ncbi:MAG: hypothetical protein Q8R28_07990 [Dehalococcoidia bacterium]|nr:hypothetical protein [Dehalococcoidia bacterium]
MAEYPGQAVDAVGRSITGAAKGLVASVANGISGAGESVQGALDQPARALGLRSGPARIVDAPLKGVVRAAAGFVNNGIISGVEDIAGGITSGLDEIPQTLAGSGRPALPKGLPSFMR